MNQSIIIEISDSNIGINIVDHIRGMISSDTIRELISVFLLRHYNITPIVKVSVPWEYSTPVDES